MLDRPIAPTAPSVTAVATLTRRRVLFAVLVGVTVTGTVVGLILTTSFSWPWPRVFIPTYPLGNFPRSIPPTLIGEQAKLRVREDSVAENGAPVQVNNFC